MEKVARNDKKGLSTFSYVIGGLSFIPVLGIPFGLIAIVYGLGTSKIGGKKLAIMGSCGIALTLLYSSWIYYSAFYDEELMAEVSQNQLTSLVHAIEFYKTNNGHYPKSLKELQNSLPEDSIPLVYDPMDAMKFDVVEPAFYHYVLEGDSHYYLLGVGTDNKPYTRDDVLPDLQIGENSGIGLIKRSISLPKKL